jgi:hypothetical protein
VTGRKPKLTPAQAAEISARHQLWRANTITKIAADYGVSKSKISEVVNGRYRPKGWDADAR